ncbi:hypothetical protein HPP92_009314 [Vanilla planifolia]|uniref:HhH-GPD domain-containing protein n=1 Tax=Vanilla planifolia TaxID=51239 RepID=A0A835RC52_VANPL|nr:hypothetical protein HPP92_009314 [Vanilla planifolia]
MASSGQATNDASFKLKTPAAGRGNLGSVGCCSPRLGAMARIGGTLSFSSPSLQIYGEQQEMSYSPDMFLPNGNFYNGSGGWCSWLAQQQVQYESPVTCFPETTSTFAGRTTISNAANPIIMGNYSKWKQDDELSLEVIDLFDVDEIENVLEEEEVSLLKDTLGKPNDASISNLMASPQYFGSVDHNSYLVHELSGKLLGKEHCLNEGENGAVELNDGSKKKPKRKKHRPKVAVEGKPARTPMPRTPLPKTPKPGKNKENQSGDRRFSQWKGSVVDSVVGVFLTQNVSDHLSSSAFMALAAKFPLQSGGNSTVSNAGKNSLSCSTSLIDCNKIQRNISSDGFCCNTSLLANSRKKDSKKESSSGNETVESATSCSTVGNSRVQFMKFQEAEVSFGQETLNNGSGLEVTVTGSIISVEVEDETFSDEVVSSENSIISSQNSSGFQLQSTDHIRSSSILDIEEEDLHFRHTNNDYGRSSFTELLQNVEECRLQTFYDSNRTNLKMQSSSTFCQEMPEIRHKLPVLTQLNHSSQSSHIDSRQQQLHSWSEKLPNDLAIENLVKANSHNKVQSDSRTATVSDSYEPTSMQSKQVSSEINFGASENLLDHKCISERVEASSRTEKSEACLQAQNMSRNDQKVSNLISKMENSRYTARYQDEMEKSSDPKVSAASNQQIHNNSGKTGTVGSTIKHENYNFQKFSPETPKQGEKGRRRKGEGEKMIYDWDSLRKETYRGKSAKERRSDTMDSLDWEAVRCADVSEISEIIRERGMNNMLAERIKDFLNRLVREHGSLDLEWLRDVAPDKSKDFLLSIRGLGLKSAECVRLLTLHHLAFPVDTNVGRICVRLGSVPLQPLPESLQLHLLELYPVLETIQKYLWPCLCKLDQKTLYELHYQMITFGKVFCTKGKPNCNSCPMKAECRHFASAFASARAALPPPEDESIVCSTFPISSANGAASDVSLRSIPQLEVCSSSKDLPVRKNCEPIVQEPPTPEPGCPESATEEACFQDPDEIPSIELKFEKFMQNPQSYMQENLELYDDDISKALVAFPPEAASIPMPKLKNVSRLRTEHQIYEIPDSHLLLEGVFADHSSSHQPIDVPRDWIWNLPRRTVYFGTSIPTIFRGLTKEDIQQCFWRGFICVRGFDRLTRAPKPLLARLHFPASKAPKHQKGKVAAACVEE